LIAEKAAVRTTLWNIFYHFFLDDASLDVLLDQCQKLRDYSIDLDTWNACEYSRFVEVGNRFTLDELHRHWAWYAETKSHSASQKKQLRNDFETGMNKIYKEKLGFSDMTASRSAGPLFMHAMETSIEATRGFWKTGTTFTRQRDIDCAAQVNPTFAYATGGEGFVAHYGTNPLGAFHLAPAFAETEVGSPPPLDEVYRTLRSQFESWCSAFHACISSATIKVKLRFLAGDVLATCQTFQLASVSADASVLPRASLWRTSLSILDGPGYVAGDAPLMFDIIDTSNLCDHIGMINVLVATAPLLKQTPVSTLYTETLLSSGEDPMVAFTESLCGDPTTMSLLLDLTPTSYLAGYKTDSNTHEVVSLQLRGAHDSKQYHEHVAWKIPSQLILENATVAHPATTEPAPLVSLLFDVYHKMFAHENFNDLFHSRLSVSSLKSRETIHYCRRSFALLVAYLMHQIDTDWEQVLDKLVDLVYNDSQLLMGMNNFQDLLTQLHVLGIRSEPNFLEGNPLLFKDKSISRFRDWSSVPPIVCIAFGIPRAKLNVFEEEDSPPTPALAVEIGGPSHSNHFASIETMFGTLSFTGNGESAFGVISEDPLGKRGESPLLVAVCVPAWMLLHDPAHTVVRLVVVSTPMTSPLMNKLGLQMAVYETSLVDATKVFIMKERPSVSAENRASLPYWPPVREAAGGVITLTLDGPKVTSMTRKALIDEKRGKEALALKDTPVTTRQAAACAIELSIGSVHRQTLTFPFSVNGSKTKLRVARQSSWVEVRVFYLLPIPQSDAF
jgi:hypothetical protein